VAQLLREQAEAADLRDLREARVGALHFALDQHAYARMLGERAEVRERDALRLGPFDTVSKSIWISAGTKRRRSPMTMHSRT